MVVDKKLFNVKVKITSNLKGFIKYDGQEQLVSPLDLLTSIANSVIFGSPNSNGNNASRGIIPSAGSGTAPITFVSQQYIGLNGTIIPTDGQGNPTASWIPLPTATLQSVTALVAFNANNVDFATYIIGRLTAPDDLWSAGALGSPNSWLTYDWRGVGNGVPDSKFFSSTTATVEFVQNSASFGCFMYGTIFRTLKDNTDVPIEVQNLKVGDLVKTEVFVNQEQCKFSQEGWQRIKRMIQRHLTADEYAEQTVILPKDAFGEGKPDKDLHVTWGHGLLLKEMKDEWKNKEYDGDHVTYSKSHALVKGDFIKLLAGHCSLCRKPNEEEKKKASEETMRRVYYHLEIEDNEEKSQHALLTHGQASESLVEL